MVPSLDRNDRFQTKPIEFYSIQNWIKIQKRQNNRFEITFIQTGFCSESLKKTWKLVRQQQLSHSKTVACKF